MKSVLASAVVVTVLLSVLGVAEAERTSLRDQPDDPVEVFHVVISPGPTAVTMFGHNAIRVRNTRTGSDTAFNWGAMKGGEIRKLLDLFSWRLNATLIVSPWNGWVQRYRDEDRTIVLQRLDLPPDRAAELVRRIRDEASRDDRSYRYDIFDDNCTTRVRDRLDDALGGAIDRAATGPSPLGSKRDHLHRAAGSSAPTDLVFSLVAVALNKRIDRPVSDRYDALFLPRDMMEILHEVELEHRGGAVRPLIAYQVTIHEGHAAPPEGHLWLWSVCGFFVLLSLPAVLFGAAGRVWAGAAVVLWGLLAGALGVALTTIAVWALPGGRIDADLWFFTPLHLLLLPLGFRWTTGRAGEAGSRVLVLLLGLSVGAAFVRLGWSWLGLAVQTNVELGVLAATVGLVLITAVRRARQRI